MPAPKSERMVVTTDSATALKWSLMGASADGKTFQESFDGPIDGMDHAIMGSGMASTVAYTRNTAGARRLDRQGQEWRGGGDGDRQTVVRRPHSHPDGNHERYARRLALHFRV
jgi:hypothetical protein